MCYVCDTYDPKYYELHLLRWATTFGRRRCSGSKARQERPILPRWQCCIGRRGLDSGGALCRPFRRFATFAVSPFRRSITAPFSPFRLVCVEPGRAPRDVLLLACG
ncbi:hypothetical protein AXF42_Ash008258 [Apostasia shenzhenica]|uniref:Uncharacterized protein n=1 Tax=Apostasia shenzhenica TaxID=1088818 RepID=A0A2I0AXD7_9ASPA|nr:hypothetical protein AXF42_Ash008258 [Apostasia shenzhenica]